MPDPKGVTPKPAPAMKKPGLLRAPAQMPEFYTGGDLTWNLEHQPNMTPATIVPDRSVGLGFHWKLAAFSLFAIPLSLILAGAAGFLVYQEITTQSQLVQKIELANKKAKQLANAAAKAVRKDIAPADETKLAASAARPLLTPEIANLVRKLPPGFRILDLRADMVYAALGEDGTPQKNVDPTQGKIARFTGTLTISGKVETTTREANLPMARQVLSALFHQPSRQLPGTRMGVSDLSFQGMFARTYDFHASASENSSTNSTPEPDDQNVPPPAPPPSKPSSSPEGLIPDKI